MKKIIPLVLLLTVYMAPAQTLQRSDNSNDRRADSTKYSKDIKAIVDSYDKAALSALYAQFSERQLLEKQDAVAYAMVRNIPIKKYNPDGTFDELMKIAEDGSPIYYTLHNVNAAISTRANYLNSGGGLGLTEDGDGMLAGVWDGGPTRPTHQEFDGPGGSNRVSINDGVTTLDGNSFHAQHVTGTIVASGVNAAAKGMAWQADCITHEWNNDVTEVTTEAGNGLLLSNHSYGYIATGIPDSWFGQYGSDAQAWDNIMFNAPYYLQIKSAGNDGNNNTANASPLDGQSAYDKLNGDACAKNNLVIGNGQDASIDGSGNLISMIRNSGSSEGPTDDYRIKPDIMGNGTSLTSTYETSDTAYGT
ncbi:MAG: S8 family serine peptidase, partial [Flavobacteriaceae bacterium]|nr:S8 family serine peptidase [Flavobacteriaceae bacterium]